MYVAVRASTPQWHALYLLGFSFLLVCCVLITSIGSPHNSCVRFWVLPCLDPSKSFPHSPAMLYSCTSCRTLSSLCPCLLILPRTTQFPRNLLADKSEWYTRQLVFLWVRLCGLPSVCVSHVHGVADTKTLSSVTAWDMLAQQWARSNCMPVCFLFRVLFLKKNIPIYFAFRYIICHIII